MTVNNQILLKIQEIKTHRETCMACNYRIPPGSNCCMENLTLQSELTTLQIKATLKGEQNDKS